MQTITTKYHGPTNTKGSRISASTSSSRPVRLMRSIENDLEIEENHARAALALMERLDLHGRMIGGHSRAGMVWVFDTDLAQKIERWDSD